MTESRGRQSARELTCEEAEDARALHERDPDLFTWTRLAETFGTTPYRVQQAVDPDAIRARNTARNDSRLARERRARAEGSRPVEALERAIRRRIFPAGADGRDLTARLLGDPPPGRSALAQRQREGSARG